MKTKPDYQWSFRCAAEDFDGARILRDAEGTDATLISIERRGNTKWLVRRDFAERARSEGIDLRRDGDEYGMGYIHVELGEPISPIEIVVGRDGDLCTTAEPRDSVWCLILGSPEDILDWHAHARAAIERGNRTTVRGWK